MAAFRVGDVGKIIVLTVLDEDGLPYDLSAATITFTVRRPAVSRNGTYTAAGVLYTDGTDGKLKYTSAAGDWTVRGYYRLEATVVIGATQFTTDYYRFLVSPRVG